MATTIVPLRNELGKVTKYIAVRTDITLQKRHEESIRQHAALQAAILAAPNCLIIALDTEGVVTSFNREAERALGRSACEVVGRATMHEWHDRDEVVSRAAQLSAELGRRVVPGFDVLVAKVLATNAPDEHEWTLVRKDGSRFPASVSVTCMRDPQGTLIGYLKVIRDITQERRDQALIAEARQRVRLAMDATRVGIWEWHVASNRVYWDEQMFRLYGLSPTPDGSVPYERWRDAVLSEDLEHQELELRKLVAGMCERAVRTFHIRRKTDGEIRTIEAHDAVRLGATGDVEWVVGTNCDITERERVAIELGRKNDELERFVFAASHDLKSPIVTILGYCSHIIASCEKANYAEIPGFVGRISRAGLRMRQCVDDLLEISRVGRANIVAKNIDVATAVNQVLEDHAGSITRRGMRIEVTTQSQSVWCNEAHFKQLLTNLISNAIKHGGSAQSPLLEIRSEPGERGQVQISVDDNGPGIEPQHVSRIFELFQRLSTDKEGTGIGLALVKRIAEQYGGRAWVIPTPGHGAKFRVLLPSHR